MLGTHSRSVSPEGDLWQRGLRTPAPPISVIGSLYNCPPRLWAGRPKGAQIEGALNPGRADRLAVSGGAEGPEPCWWWREARDCTGYLQWGHILFSQKSTHIALQKPVIHEVCRCLLWHFHNDFSHTHGPRAKAWGSDVTWCLGCLTNPRSPAVESSPALLPSSQDPLLTPEPLRDTF